MKVAFGEKRAVPSTPTVWDVSAGDLIQKRATKRRTGLACPSFEDENLLGQSGFERVARDAGVLVRIVGVRDVLLKHAMGVEK